MGFVAVSGDEESQRIGCRDITVAWRGTVAPAEWYEDLQNQLKPLGSDHGDAKVRTNKSRILVLDDLALYQ